MLATGPAVVAVEGDTMMDIAVDLQADPATLVGGSAIGDFFVITGDVYEPGTDTDVSDFICRGVNLAELDMAALDEFPTVTAGGIAGQVTQVQQTVIFDDGSLHVLGTEPGPVMAVVGGTGGYAGATGTLTFETVLGEIFDPAFSAADVAGVPVTFLSSRLTFSIKLDGGHEGDDKRDRTDRDELLRMTMTELDSRRHGHLPAGRATTAIRRTVRFDAPG